VARRPPKHIAARRSTYESMKFSGFLLYKKRRLIFSTKKEDHDIHFETRKKINRPWILQGRINS
jgi:hypothetical protein